MFLIIEWIIHPQTAMITQDGDDEGASNAIFDTKEKAEQFAINNCAFEYQIIEIKGEE